MTLASKEFMYVGGICLVIGYAIFQILLRMLPHKLSRENEKQHRLEIGKAQKRKDQILKESRSHFQSKLKMSQETLETTLEEHGKSLKAAQEELVSQEEFVGQAESRLAKEELETAQAQRKVDLAREQLKVEEEKKEELRIQTVEHLARISEVDIQRERNRLKEKFVSDRHLDYQKRVKDLTEDLNANSKKLADRMLSRLLSRYEPVFAWPKATTQVDFTDPKQPEMLSSGEYSLLSDLKEISEGVDIGFGTDDNGKPMFIKVVGGYGIYKEAARLTLEEVLVKGPSAWAKATAVYNRHKQSLQVQALGLGRQAAMELHLDGIHEEILRMIGALNWRTSYRQNQFHHSLEVAKLAGILAYELKVDPDLAKRAGILHDIGKTIDYRIEGSHAVISGDYADRYGESRLVCDTVMSHHNDLALETPLAYVLKTADTLSGARPGARVNLEEGYQIRLSAIAQVVKSFPGIIKVEIMNGGREVHVDVNYKKVRENKLEELTAAIARKIEVDVAFPGQIKVIVSRRFEVVAVA